MRLRLFAFGILQVYTSFIQLNQIQPPEWFIRGSIIELHFVESAETAADSPDVYDLFGRLY